MTDSSENPFPTSLKISPQQFKIDVILKQDMFLDMQLENFSSDPIAFKVKTTARDRYLLRPTQDIIPPNSSKTCRIVLSAMSEYPDSSNPKNIRDKFLIQSLPAAGISNNNSELSKFWKEKEAEHNPKANKFVYAEQRIKCKLNIPEKSNHRDEKNEANNNTAANTQNNNNNIKPSSPKTQTNTLADRNNKSTQQSTSTTTSTLNTSTSHPSSSSVPSHNATQSSTEKLDSSSFVSNFETKTSPPVTSSKPDSGSNSAGNSVNSSAYDYHSDFDRLTSDRKRREYDELMDFVVKLTAQMEEQKAQQSIITDKYQKALNTINTLTKKNQQLQLQIQQQSTSSDSKLDAENSSMDEKGNDKSAKLSTDKLKMNGNKESELGFQLWHVVLMAVICFLLGRILS